MEESGLSDSGSFNVKGPERRSRASTIAGQVRHLVRRATSDFKPEDKALVEPLDRLTDAFSASYADLSQGLAPTPALTDAIARVSSGTSGTRGSRESSERSRLPPWIRREKPQRSPIGQSTKPRTRSIVDTFKPSFTVRGSRLRPEPLIKTPKGTDDRLSQAVTRWQAAFRKIRAALRFEEVKFRKARRQRSIEREDPPGKYEFTIRHAGDATRIHDPVLLRMVAASKGTTFCLEHDSTVQHTIRWSSVVTDPEGNLLPPGSVNLFKYPQCTLETAPLHPHEVEGSELACLTWIMTQAAAEPQRVFWRHDVSGGFAVHSLLIANTKHALSLCRLLFSQWPRLLLLEHCPGLFHGETALHIYAVNRREEELCAALAIGQIRLSGAQFMQLLRSRAKGFFFRRSPMLFYGSSPLSFCASFGLTRAVLRILEYEKKVLLQRASKPEATRAALTDWPCPTSGFFPLHCAVANGCISMYDFLTGANNHLSSEPGEVRLSPGMVVDMEQKTIHATFEEWADLSPLQLAAKLGDKRMCKHILNKRLQLNWRWGPLTSLRLPLDEIDSAGAGGNDIMELAGDHRATLSTQQMLLDDFMQGFIYSLVCQKWQQCTRYIFYSLRVIELGYLACLISLSFGIKMDPSMRARMLAWLVLLAGVMLALIEALGMTLWWRNDATRAFSSWAAMRVKMVGAMHWALSFAWFAKITGYLAAICACVYFLYEDTAPDAHTSRSDAPLYLLFGVSSYVQGKSFIANVCVSPHLPALGGVLSPDPLSLSRSRSLSLSLSLSPSPSAPSHGKLGPLLAGWGLGDCWGLARGREGGGCGGCWGSASGSVGLCRRRHA